MMIYIVLLYLLPFCTCQSTEAVFVVNFDSQIESCSDESSAFVDTSAVNVGRYNETYAYMYGDIEFLKDVGSNTMVEIILEKEASGKFEIMFTHEICDFCGEIGKGVDSDYHQYFKYFGIPDTCPFEANKYPIQEFVISTDDLPINSNTCGRYVVYLNLYNNPENDCKTTKEFMFCLTMKLIIETAD